MSRIGYTPGWGKAHPKVQAYLDTRSKDRLDAILKQRGTCFADWLRQQIDRCHAERLPESQGDVKRVIPSEVAALAAEVLGERGNFLRDRARQEHDPVRRGILRQQADPYLDAASWFNVVEDDRAFREHLLSSGQRTPRDRAQARPAVQALKPRLSPQVAMPSSTREAPTG